MKQKLKESDVFRRLSIPLLPEQELELEKSLIRDGCREPVIVWNDMVVDGYKRYRICEAECIEYNVEEKNFASQAEAVSWVCREKIPEQKKLSNSFRYIVGRFYAAQKQIYHDEQKLPEDSRTVVLDSTCSRVSHTVGKELNLSRTAVESYGALAISLNEIAEKAWPLFEAILSGTIQMTIKEIQDYSTIGEKELLELCKTKWHLAGTSDNAVKIRNREKKEETPNPVAAIPLSVKIKEMPEYDPDMEVCGLTLTIPAWITAIGRAEKKTGQATDKAKEQLSRSLIELRDKIDTLLTTLNY